MDDFLDPTVCQLWNGSQSVVCVHNGKHKGTIALSISFSIDLPFSHDLRSNVAKQVIWFLRLTMACHGLCLR